LEKGLPIDPQPSKFEKKKKVGGKGGNLQETRIAQVFKRNSGDVGELMMKLEKQTNCGEQRQCMYIDERIPLDGVFLVKS